MPLPRFAILVLLCAFPFAVCAQQTSAVSKDPQAVAVLSQSLASAGAAAIISLQDYTAQGNLTYFWGGDQVQAAATIRGMGIANFRLDATLPQGVRTFACSGYAGVFITETGNRITPSFYNQMTSGSMTMPYVRVTAALADSSTTITYLGPTTVGDRQLTRIRFTPSFGQNSPGHGRLSGLGTYDLYVDPSTNLIASLVELQHSDTNYPDSYPHEIDFANYQVVSGLAVPFTVTEKISGEPTWTVQLTSIQFNSGLDPTVFVP